MTTVEVLAPVRLETRFVAPADRTDGVDEWMLRLRVYPDEFSIRRVVAAPTPEELDRLEESLAAMPRLDERAAFASFAGAVGPARALALWRRCVVGGTVDRTEQKPSDHRVRVHGPAGLPDELQVWFVHAGGAQELATTLVLDPSAIGNDLDIESFAGSAELAAGTLPQTWWLSYERAREVGLGADLDIGAALPRLEALVVVGRSDTDAADLVDAHNATSRLAVLAPGTPSNTVEGEPTTDFGDHTESLYPLLHVDPKSQQSSRVVLEALTGRVPADAVPILGGDLDHFGPGSLAVQGFWPVLWGRALRDVTTTDLEIDLARWALRHLAVEGPRPAIRVGDQPYGLLPTSAYAAWVPDPTDPLAHVEDRIRRWALDWRAGAAAAAEAANAWVEGADTEQLLDVLGLHAPSRYRNARPVADAFAVQVSHLLAGDPAPPVTQWDIATAATWRGMPFPAFPIAAAAGPGQLPGPPGDAVEDPDRLKRLLFMEPEPLYFQGDPPMGLVGHLVRESMIAARAIVGEAIVRWSTSGWVDLAVAMPLDDETTFRDHVMRGTDSAVDALAGSGDADAELVATRFREVVDALTVLAELWEPTGDAMLRATLAALDTASFRVDPWLTGLADKRLQAMTTAGAPVKLGAFGWVDSPEPWPGASALAPGPTEAGLLHAPSHDQALTAALLRDATVRHPTDGRWDLTIDSAKVRASVALAERVRLGVHPYEALGLEVEKVAGDWDVVRVLREHYPLAADQDGRRSCDGAAALAAARTDGFAGVVGLPADLAGRLEPLDHVLDTYADLLVADGVHALVTGRADLGNAALEAAAGLGAPPDLRAIRTPRAATTVRVAAWAMVAAGSVPPLTVDADPSVVADPAFAALAVAEGATTAEGRQRLAAVLGGGDSDAPVPALVGGSYPGLPDSADDDLHAAAVADLGARLAQVRQLTQTVHDAVAALDPTAAGVDDELTAVGARWRVDLPAGADPDPVADRQFTLSAALADRLAAPPPGPPAKTDGAVNERRAAIRMLAGDLALPVLPVVPTALLPRFQPAPDLDRTWLEIVAAVRPRLASLEAHQLTSPWPAVLSGAADPWSPHGPVLAAYGPAVDHDGVVAVAALDAWTDSIPSRRHSTAATFGFNAPKSRAPQAVLLAVPPDPAVRLTNDDLLAVVLETRELAHARGTRPTDRAGLPWATPGPLVHATPQSSFITGWN